MNEHPSSEPKSENKFPLGQTVITANAQANLPPLKVFLSLRRHQSGDWGDVCEDDRQQKENALVEGLRLMSVYRTTDGVKFWIITEWDRSVTTILMPEDY